ncbi:unnamed protein product [Brugia timori]|uniref:Uncharacterized protein n=1 Tax=Brugia timori TaxID=42155 RepID=A0A0R3R2G2_9BILA|nr:unnamed protein product [Brugia timori]
MLKPWCVSLTIMLQHIGRDELFQVFLREKDCSKG